MGVLQPELDGTVNRRLFERYDPNQAIALLDAVPDQYAYNYVPDQLKRLWHDLDKEFGERGFTAFQRATLRRMRLRFDARVASERYSPGIVECFRAAFRRIGKNIDDPACNHYRRVNDTLLKDLAIGSQKLFPAGAQVVESNSGFHRSLSVRAGWRQAAGVGGLLIRAGGNKPFFQLHTHSGDLTEFNQQGWWCCYLRLAEMLAQCKAVKGVWSCSWYFDPALSDISPRLAYLRELPMHAGARLFYSHEDLQGDALVKSANRRRLHREGAYTPRAYALIWLRAPLLSWARTQRESTPG